jgi:16S rRNA (guanine966-N2)-methyltransferase
MRVIAGKYRSRLLIAPKGLETRPTSDRLRETLFNVLAQSISGSVFLDLYAGSGAVGIEALSRGAKETVFVENAESALRAIRSNLASLKIHGGYSLEARSASAAIKRLSSANRLANLVFLDPPYSDTAEYESTLTLLGSECRRLLPSGATVIVEHLKNLNLTDTYGALNRHRSLKQGDSVLSFYSL